MCPLLHHTIPLHPKPELHSPLDTFRRFECSSAWLCTTGSAQHSWASLHLSSDASSQKETTTMGSLTGVCSSSIKARFTMHMQTLQHASMHVHSCGWDSSQSRHRRCYGVSAACGKVLTWRLGAVLWGGRVQFGPACAHTVPTGCPAPRDRVV